MPAGVSLRTRFPTVTGSCDHGCSSQGEVRHDLRVSGGAKARRVKVNATPETLTVRPGDTVDWTVVNATGRRFAGPGIDQLEGQEPGEGRAQGLRPQGAGPMSRQVGQDGRLPLQHPHRRRGGVRPRARGHELRRPGRGRPLELTARPAPGRLSDDARRAPASAARGGDVARLPRAGVLRAGAARLLCGARARRRQLVVERAVDHSGARHGGRDATRPRASRSAGALPSGRAVPDARRRRHAVPDARSGAASPAACQMTGVCNQPAAALAAVLMQAAVPPAAFALVPRARAGASRLAPPTSSATRSPSRPIHLRLDSSLASRCRAELRLRSRRL